MEEDSSLEWFWKFKQNQFEEFKLDFAVELERAMQSNGIGKQNIAESFGVSTSRITEVLRGDANLTMQEMQKLANLANHKISIRLMPLK